MSDEMKSYERTEGKRGVRIEGGRFPQLLSMRNGYQWSGMPVDREVLQMLHAAISEVLGPDAALSRLRDTQRVLVEALRGAVVSLEATKRHIDDLVALYAPEHCLPEAVKDAADRVHAHGMLWTSASVVAPAGDAIAAARAALASVEQPEPRRQPFQLNPPPVYDQHYAATQSEVEQQEPSEDARDAARSALDELRAAFCAVRVVGSIDNHHVIRRASVIDLIDRRRAAMQEPKP